MISLESIRNGAEREAPVEGLTTVIDRNMAALHERRRRVDAEATIADRIAEVVTRFTGSMTFVAIHLVVVAAWVAVNLGWLPAVPVFDETFVILATTASVEAIFLSTFVLISQNRAAALADRRADLNLQINLLAEHEITRILTLTRAIADRYGIEEAQDPALEELEGDIAPEKVLDEIEVREEAERAG